MSVGGPLLLSGFTIALLLLLVFSGALASVIIQGQRLSCNCFGSSEQSITWLDLWRNAGFLLCAALGLGVLVWQPGAQANVDGIEGMILFLGAMVFVLVWTHLRDIVSVLRRPE